MSKEELDNFLLSLLNADKVSIRRKLIYMKNFLEENTILLNQNKDEEMMSKEELIEEILDIINSENSGLSHQQRLNEIESLLNQNKDD